jgi:hypothetical protein
MIKNDDVGAVQLIPRKMSRSAARTLLKFVFDFIKSNGAIYDAKALFHADHHNLGSAALSSTTLNAAVQAIAAQTEMDSGEILGLVAKYLLVPNTLAKTAYELTSKGYGVNNAVMTYLQSKGIAPIEVDYWTDVNDWALCIDPLDGPTIEIGFLDGKEEPELYVADNPSAGSLFTHDKIDYKIRHIYGGSVQDYRGMYKAVVV